MKNTERFVSLKTIKKLNEDKRIIDEKLNSYTKAYCNICGDTNPLHGFYSILPLNRITCNRCKLSNEEYEITFGCKKELIDSPHIIKQNELYELYINNNDIFNQNDYDEFDFLGEDGNIYVFNIDRFEYRLEKHGIDNVWTEIQVGIKNMLEYKYCKLKTNN